MKQHASHVVIGGLTLLYDSKAPYVASGQSILGALEYDPEEDRVRCHECGGYFHSMGGHLGAVHGMTAREYKIAHGLNLRAALCGENLRKSRATTGLRLYAEGKLQTIDPAVAVAAKRAAGSVRHNPHELDNRRGTCTAQYLDKLRRLAARLKRTPTEAELKEASLWAGLMINFGNIRTAMRIANLMPRGKGKRANGWSDEALLAVLSDFVKREERPPACSDFRRGLLPSYALYYRRFGSIGAAVSRAAASEEVSA